MSSQEKDVLETIDSSNIFDEFETGELKDELQANKPKEKKNMYDYLSISAGIFSIIFWTGLFLSGMVYGYVNIQENVKLDNSSTLNPVCGLLIGDIDNKNSSGNCTSISYVEQYYNKELAALKETQFQETMSVLEQIFKTENFLKSKEVVFLDTISKNKLRPLEILDAFYRLQYDYDSSLQERIQCSNIAISYEGVLTASCAAFSGGYEDNIRGFDAVDGTRVTGTSISVANSFLNYIEKKSDDFVLLDRQKTFKSESVLSQFTYLTKKTSFELTLQYNSDNLISN